jgi:hypothetical protein
MPAKKPMMRENISSRPTDSSGRRATDADLGIGPGVAAIRKAAAEKITKREGTTSPSGARPAVLRVAPPKPVKPVAKIIPAKQQAIIRTTTNMRPTPATKKR